MAIALALPLGLSAAALAADETTAAPGEPGIVFKDSQSAPGTMRLSKLIGAEAFDPAGKDVGRIKDVVLNSSRTDVDYLVLGQAKTMGQKLVALPYKAMKLGSPREDRVYLAVNEEVLSKAPGFDESKWPTEANADYYRSLDTYYNTHLAEMVNKPATQPAEAQKASAQAGEDMQWSRRASQLEDRAVISPNGKDLGKIKDVVLDQKTGNVIYAAFKDNNGKMHAIPLSVFKLEPQDKKLVLDTTREDLKAMPSFDDDKWPSQADPRWSSAADMNRAQ